MFNSPLATKFSINLMMMYYFSFLFFEPAIRNSSSSFVLKLIPSLSIMLIFHSSLSFRLLLCAILYRWFHEFVGSASTWGGFNSAGSKIKKEKEYLIIKLGENLMFNGLLNTKSSFVKNSSDSAQRPFYNFRHYFNCHKTAKREREQVQAT